MPEFDPESIPILDDIIENAPVEEEPVPVDAGQSPDELPDELPDEPAAEQPDAYPLEPADDLKPASEDKETDEYPAADGEAGTDFAADSSTPDIDDDALPLSANEPLDDVLLFEAEEQNGEAAAFAPAPADNVQQETVLEENDDKDVFTRPFDDDSEEEWSPEPVLSDGHQEEEENDVVAVAGDAHQAQAVTGTGTPDESALEIRDADPDTVGIDTGEERPENDVSTTPSPETEALQAVIDDIVRQLLPDLEQQLRFLIRQALEERLPETIRQQLEADRD